MQVALRARSFARDNAGNSNAAKMAMMAMTTSNSTSVNAWRDLMLLSDNGRRILFCAWVSILTSHKRLRAEHLERRFPDPARIGIGSHRAGSDIGAPQSVAPKFFIYLLRTVCLASLPDDRVSARVQRRKIHRDYEPEFSAQRSRRNIPQCFPPRRNPVFSLKIFAANPLHNS